MLCTEQLQGTPFTQPKIGAMSLDPYNAMGFGSKHAALISYVIVRCGGNNYIVFSLYKVKKNLESIYRII